MKTPEQALVDVQAAFQTKLAADQATAAANFAVKAAEKDYTVDAPVRAAAVVKASLDNLVAAKTDQTNKFNAAIAANLALAQAKADFNQALDVATSIPSVEQV